MSSLKTTRMFILSHLITAGGQKDREGRMELGANAYITKSLKPLEFRETVRKFITEVKRVNYSIQNG